jgi:hypothetical protein
MDDARQRVFGGFSAALELHEKSHPETPDAYLSVIAIAVDACRGHAAAGLPLDDPVVTQMLTLVENAAAAARKTAGLQAKAVHAQRAAELADADTLAADVDITEHEADGAAVNTDARLPTVPPVFIVETSSIGSNSSSSSNMTANNMTQQSPSKGGGGGAGLDAAAGASTITRLGATVVPGASSVASAALAPAAASSKPSPGGGNEFTSAPQSPSPSVLVEARRDFIAEARMENARLERMCMLQSKTHRNPEVLKMSLLREQAANTEHAKVLQREHDEMLRVLQVRTFDDLAQILPLPSVVSFSRWLSLDNSQHLLAPNTLLACALLCTALASFMLRIYVCSAKTKRGSHENAARQRRASFGPPGHSSSS